MILMLTKKWIVKCCFLGMLVLIHADLPAQSLNNSYVSPIIAMSVGASNQSALFGFLLNSANLELIRKTEVGISATQKYGLKEMKEVLFAIAKQNAKISVGFSIHNCGSTFYNERLLSVYFSKNLQKNIHLGIDFGWQRRSMQSSYVDNQLQFGVGSLFILSDNLKAGISIKKGIVISSTQAYQSNPHVDVFAGISYALSKQCYIAIDCNKQTNFPAAMRLLFHYDVAKNISFKYAYAADSNTQFWGLGFNWKKIRVSTNIAYHPQLGAYPGLAVASNRN